MNFAGHNQSTDCPSSSQPYLATIEKTWVAFQILTALRDARTRKVSETGFETHSSLLLYSRSLMETSNRRTFSSLRICLSLSLISVHRLSRLFFHWMIRRISHSSLTPRVGGPAILPLNASSPQIRISPGLGKSATKTPINGASATGKSRKLWMFSRWDVCSWKCGRRVVASLVSVICSLIGTGRCR